MTSIDDQLRAFARRLDDSVTPVRADDVVVPDAVVVRERAKRFRGTVVAAAIALAAAIVIASVVVVRDRDTTRNPVGGLRTTVPSTTSPTNAPCVMARSADGSGALAQPATITLPSGNTFAIRPGNPITAPNDVTLDGDGSAPGTVSDPSVVGGQVANSLLWGAATPNGPFAGLDHVAVGSTITLDQTQPSPCTQNWRVVSITSPDAQNSPASRPSLTLVGFQPTDGGGPNVLFYVDAVPASEPCPRCSKPFGS
jgi:hypothetical protein